MSTGNEESMTIGGTTIETVHETETLTGPTESNTSPEGAQLGPLDPSNLVVPEISSVEVDKVMDQIKENPECISAILGQLKGNKELFDTVKSKVMGQDIMRQVNKSGERVPIMTAKKKREMQKIQKSFAATEIKAAKSRQISCCFINGSKKLKSVHVNRDFPEGTNYQGEPFLVKSSPIEDTHTEEELKGDDILSRDIYMFFDDKSKGKNRRIEKMVGFKAGRDAYFMRMDENGTIYPLSTKEMENL